MVGSGISVKGKNRKTSFKNPSRNGEVVEFHRWRMAYAWIYDPPPKSNGECKEGRSVWLE